jgi:hypothetical protein
VGRSVAPGGLRARRLGRRPRPGPAGNTDANFSLVAIQYGDGHASGQWTDQFGQGQGGIHVEVNCVFVVGNQAWISGIIKQGTFNGGDSPACR